jgi:hypothetical protein
VSATAVSSAEVSALPLSVVAVSAPPAETVPSGVSEVQAASKISRRSEDKLRIRIARSV